LAVPCSHPQGAGGVKHIHLASKGGSPYLAVGIKHVHLASADYPRPRTARRVEYGEVPVATGRTRGQSREDGAVRADERKRGGANVTLLRRLGRGGSRTKYAHRQHRQRGDDNDRNEVAQGSAKRGEG